MAEAGVFVPSSLDFGYQLGQSVGGAPFLITGRSHVMRGEFVVVTGERVDVEVALDAEDADALEAIVRRATDRARRRIRAATE